MLPGFPWFYDIVQIYIKRPDCMQSTIVQQTAAGKQHILHEMPIAMSSSPPSFAYFAMKRKMVKKTLQILKDCLRTHLRVMNLLKENGFWQQLMGERVTWQIVCITEEDRVPGVFSSKIGIYKKFVTLFIKKDKP